MESLSIARVFDGNGGAYLEAWSSMSTVSVPSRNSWPPQKDEDKTMDEQLFERVAKAVERLTLLMAMDFATKLGEEADLGRKADRFRRCGFSNSEIADILNTTANSIGVALHRNRSSSRRGKAKR